MFIGVLYFVVGEDIILPQRTITACFREANSLPYGVCAKTKHTDKSKFDLESRELCPMCLIFFCEMYFLYQWKNLKRVYIFLPKNIDIVPRFVYNIVKLFQGGILP